jgi:hypothetical protein
MYANLDAGIQRQLRLVNMRLLHKRRRVVLDLRARRPAHRPVRTHRHRKPPPASRHAGAGERCPLDQLPATKQPLRCAHPTARTTHPWRHLGTTAEPLMDPCVSVERSLLNTPSMHPTWVQSTAGNGTVRNRHRCLIRTGKTPAPPPSQSRRSRPGPTPPRAFPALRRSPGPSQSRVRGRPGIGPWYVSTSCFLPHPPTQRAPVPSLPSAPLQYCSSHQVRAVFVHEPPLVQPQHLGPQLPSNVPPKDAVHDSVALQAAIRSSDFREMEEGAGQLTICGCRTFILFGVEMFKAEH